MTKKSRATSRCSNEEVKLYAWWAGYGEEADGRRRARTLTNVHVYATRLRPSRPLDIGSPVRLVALSKSIPPIPLAALDQYVPYDPHVVGRVSCIVGFGGGWVRVTIANGCGGNNVETVGIDMPHVPGVTVRRTWLEGPEACLQWVGPCPEGELRQLGDGACLALCAADRCLLEKPRDPTIVPFRAWPASKEEREKRRPRGAESGETATHKWT